MCQARPEPFVGIISVPSPQQLCAVYAFHLWINNNNKTKKGGGTKQNKKLGF